MLQMEQQRDGVHGNFLVCFPVAEWSQVGAGSPWAGILPAEWGSVGA